MVYKQGHFAAPLALIYCFSLSPHDSWVLSAYLLTQCCVPGVRKNAGHNLSKHPLKETKLWRLFMPSSDHSGSQLLPRLCEQLPFTGSHWNTDTIVHMPVYKTLKFYEGRNHAFWSPRYFHSISPQLICDEQMTSPSFQGMTAGGHIPKNTFKAIYKASDDGYWTESHMRHEGQTQIDTFLLTKYAVQPCP